MIKKSYRKSIDEHFKEPNVKLVYKKAKSIVTLLNRSIHSSIKIPEGHYNCPECNAKKVIKMNPQKQSTISTYDGNLFQLSMCKKCRGRGYVDWVSNTMHNPRMAIGQAFAVPFTVLCEKKLEAASIIFFNLYFMKSFYDFDTQFNIKSISDKKTVNELFRYFTEYKKAREKRQKFIVNNFDIIRNLLLDKTKVKTIPKHKIFCNVCNSNPFDIIHDVYVDKINLKICGNCYGNGYQAKKNTRMISNYIFPIENSIYTSRDKILKSILTEAEENSFGFIWRIDKLEYKDQQIKKKKEFTSTLKT